MTLGNAAAARVRLIVWCKGCQHQVEPDPAEMAARYGAETPANSETDKPSWETLSGCVFGDGKQHDDRRTETKLGKTTERRDCLGNSA